MNGSWQSWYRRALALLEDTGNTGAGNPASIRGRIRARMPSDTSGVLKLLRTVLIVLLAIQGLRVAVPVLRAELLLRSAAATVEEKTREKFRDPLEQYNPILEKGVLGVPPQEQPPQLFGVLGTVALIGGAPEQVQEYSEGGVLPSGEKVIHIGVDSVELEKDGQKQTLSVFPDLKRK